MSVLLGTKAEGQALRDHILYKHEFEVLINAHWGHLLAWLSVQVCRQMSNFENLWTQSLTILGFSKGS